MAVRETYISRILSALSDGVAKVDEKIHPEEINLLKGILIKIRGGKNMTQSKNKLIEMLEYVIADHSAEEKRII